MKKVLFVIAVALMALLSISAQAQVMDTTLVAKHGKIYMGEHKMNNSELTLLDSFDMDKYKAGRTKYTIGVSMIAVGAVPGVIATYALVQNARSKAARNPQDNRPGSGMGEALALFSGAAMVVFEGIGIPLTCSGAKNIRDAASDYNASRPVQVSFQPMVSCDENLRPTAGMSLVLKF